MGKDDRGEDEERENLMVELGERGNRNRGDTVAGKDANADGQDRSRANTNNEKTEIAPRREGKAKEQWSEPEGSVKEERNVSTETLGTPATNVKFGSKGWA